MNAGDLNAGDLNAGEPSAWRHLAPAVRRSGRKVVGAAIGLVLIAALAVVMLLVDDVALRILAGVTLVLAVAALVSLARGLRDGGLRELLRNRPDEVVRIEVLPESVVLTDTVGRTRELLVRPRDMVRTVAMLRGRCPTAELVDPAGTPPAQ